MRGRSRVKSASESMGWVERSCVLVPSSCAPLHVDYEEPFGTLEIELSSFTDGGWQSKPEGWTETSSEPLAERIQALLGVPQDEAEDLAQKILGPLKDEWRARGGEDACRRVSVIAFGVWLLAALLVASGVFGIVVTIAWLT